MGNNLSKPVKKFNFSIQEQRLIREAKYIDRKIWKPTSVKKRGKFNNKTNCVTFLISRTNLYLWASHLWIM